MVLVFQYKVQKRKKELTKIVYLFSTDERTTVLNDIEWNSSNKKIQDLIIEFKSFMEERHQDMLKFVVYLKTRLYLYINN